MGPSKGPVIQVWGLEERCVGNLLGILHPAVPPPPSLSAALSAIGEGRGDGDPGIPDEAKGH